MLDLSGHEQEIGKRGALAHRLHAHGKIPSRQLGDPLNRAAVVQALDELAAQRAGEDFAPSRHAKRKSRAGIGFANEQESTGRESRSGSIEKAFLLLPAEIE